MADTHRFRLGGSRWALLLTGATLASMVTLAAAPPAAARPATIVPTGDRETATPQPTEPDLVPPVTVATTPATIAPTAQTSPPVELAEPVVITHFVRAPSSAGRTRAPAAPSAAELPNTGGGGSLLMLMSALGALAIGGLALWWGSRKQSGIGARGLD